MSSDMAEMAYFFNWQVQACSSVIIICIISSNLFGEIYGQTNHFYLLHMY